MRRLTNFRSGWKPNNSVNNVKFLAVCWVVVLTPSLLNVGVGLGVDGASAVTTLQNIADSDYVSLTSRRQGVKKGENEVNATNWVVGGITDCSQLPPGCSCGSESGLKASSVVCACRDENEVSC